MGSRCPRCKTVNLPRARYCSKCKELLHASAQILSTGRLAPKYLLRERYRIIQLLDIGGMGAVYKAADLQSDNRIVAIKEMSKARLTPQEAENRFKHEALILAKLTHPHLPQIYDYFLHTKRWYLVMDFIEGETLHRYLYETMDGHIPIQEVLDIGIQLCNVLGYLHTRSLPIIFRDLKPSNIMRTPDGHLYLIDFGIARHFKAGQANDTLPLGTPGYSAPELSWQQSTQLSDIFSLGATLHELLTANNPGQQPFNFVTLRSYNYSIPSTLDKLIMSMLNKDPHKRPNSMAIIEQELQKISNKWSSNMLSFSYGAGYRAHLSTRLYVEEGLEQGNFYELNLEDLSIGRQKDSDIYLKDTFVSRLHATLLYLGDGNYALQDEDSANGTIVNSKWLKPFQPHKLKNGDRIQICRTKFIFMKR
jgi:eukaryotic-like serine/threonine-protein kinase